LFHSCFFLGCHETDDEDGDGDDGGSLCRVMIIIIICEWKESKLCEKTYFSIKTRLAVQRKRFNNGDLICISLLAWKQDFPKSKGAVDRNTSITTTTSNHWKKKKKEQDPRTPRETTEHKTQGTLTHSTSGTLLSISLSVFPVNLEEEILLHVIRRSSFKSHSFSFAHLTSSHTNKTTRETDAKLSPQERSRSHTTLSIKSTYTLLPFYSDMTTICFVTFCK